MAGSNRKKKRTSKTSKGIHGATHHPLSEQEKALLGKGVVQRFQPIVILHAWKGAREETYPLFDKEQAEENRKAFPHLFEW